MKKEEEEKEKEDSLQIRRTVACADEYDRM